MKPTKSSFLIVLLCFLNPVSSLFRIKDDTEEQIMDFLVEEAAPDRLTRSQRVNRTGETVILKQNSARIISDLIKLKNITILNMYRIKKMDEAFEDFEIRVQDINETIAKLEEEHLDSDKENMEKKMKSLNMSKELMREEVEELKEKLEDFISIKEEMEVKEEEVDKNITEVWKVLNKKSHSQDLKHVNTSISDLMKMTNSFNVRIIQLERQEIKTQKKMTEMEEEINHWNITNQQKNDDFKQLEEKLDKLEKISEGQMKQKDISVLEKEVQTLQFLVNHQASQIENLKKTNKTESSLPETSTSTNVSSKPESIPLTEIGNNQNLKLSKNVTEEVITNKNWIQDIIFEDENLKKETQIFPSSILEDIEPTDEPVSFDIFNLFEYEEEKEMDEGSGNLWHDLFRRRRKRSIKKQRKSNLDKMLQGLSKTSKIATHLTYIWQNLLKLVQKTDHLEKTIEAKHLEHETFETLPPKINITLRSSMEKILEKLKLCCNDEGKKDTNKIDSVDDKIKDDVDNKEKESISSQLKQLFKRKEVLQTIALSVAMISFCVTMSYLTYKCCRRHLKVKRRKITKRKLKCEKQEEIFFEENQEVLMQRRYLVDNPRAQIEMTGREAEEAINPPPAGPQHPVPEEEIIRAEQQPSFPSQHGRRRYVRFTPVYRKRLPNTDTLDLVMERRQL